MAERERADEPLLVGAGLLGVYHHGHRGRDALVAAARVAHHGDHGAGHAGVAGGRGVGQDVGEDAVAHRAQPGLAAHGLAHAVTEVVLEGAFGGRLVQPARLKDEPQLLDGRRRGEVPHLVQRQLHGLAAALALAAGRGVEQHFAVAGDVDERGVSAGDDGRRTVAVGFGFDFDVELLLDVLLERYGDALLIDVAPSALHGLGRGVAQHFELVLRAADERAQRDGDGQADHSRAGNAHAHGVLEDVGREPCGDLLGRAAQRLGGAGHAERHGDGLRTSDCGYDLAVDEVDDAFSFFLSYHVRVVFHYPRKDSHFSVSRNEKSRISRASLRIYRAAAVRRQSGGE